MSTTTHIARPIATEFAAEQGRWHFTVESNHDEIEYLLSKGWEPFSVYTTPYSSVFVALRKREPVTPPDVPPPPAVPPPVPTPTTHGQRQGKGKASQSRQVRQQP